MFEAVMRVDALTYLRAAMCNATIDFRDGQWEAIDHMCPANGLG